MKDKDEVALKNEIDEIAQTIKDIIRRIDSLDPGKSENSSQNND
jgi:hypothetical protein